MRFNDSKAGLTRSRLFGQIIIKYIKLNVKLKTVSIINVKFLSMYGFVRFHESSSNHHHWKIYIINMVHGTLTTSYARTRTIWPSAIGSTTHCTCYYDGIQHFKFQNLNWTHSKKENFRSVNWNLNGVSYIQI